MHRQTISDRVLAATVWATCAGERAVERLGDAAERRVRRLRDDGGAQVAEYAMLGGVSAAACGAIIVVLKQESTFQKFVDGVFGVLLRAVRSWF